MRDIERSVRRIETNVYMRQNLSTLHWDCIWHEVDAGTRYD